MIAMTRTQDSAGQYQGAWIQPDAPNYTLLRRNNQNVLVLSEARVGQANSASPGIMAPTPSKVVSAHYLTSYDQSWYWTPAWQKMEAEADEDLRSGHYRVFDTADDFVAFLDSEEDYEA